MTFIKEKLTNKYLIAVLIVLEICMLFLAYKSFSNKSIVLDDVQFKPISNTEMFAFFIEQEDGLYKKTEDSTWPSTGYRFNSKKSGCINQDGELIADALKFKNDSVTVEVGVTGYCYLYFDIFAEAYAIYTDSNQTLTFLRSRTPINPGDEYNGETINEVYRGFEKYIYTSKSEVPWNSYNTGNMLYNIVVEEEIMPISTAYWFSDYNILESIEIDLTNINTSQVIDMSYMFFETNAQIWDLSGWDTSNVTNMTHMFDSLDTDGYCTSQIIGIEDWDVSNVTNMSYMFANSVGSELTNVPDISNWDVSNVTEMSWMLSDSSLDNVVDISEWDVSNVKNMQGMFAGTNVSNLSNITKWDVSNVTDMGSMFSFSITYEDINLTGWDVSNVVYYNDFLFSSGFDWIENQQIIPPVWENVYFGVYSETDKSLRIYSNLGSVEIPKIGDLYNGRAVTQVYNISLTNKPVECNNTITPTSIVVEDEINVFIGSQWFYNCTMVSSIDVTKLNMSNATQTYAMFYNVGKDASVGNFPVLGINEWDVSNITNMSYMFSGFSSDLDLTDWDVSNVTSMGAMFQDATMSDVGDITGWVTSNVTDMSYMFDGPQLTLDLSGWDVSKVTSYDNFSAPDSQITPPDFG